MFTAACAGQCTCVGKMCLRLWARLVGCSGSVYGRGIGSEARESRRGRTRIMMMSHLESAPITLPRLLGMAHGQWHRAALHRIVADMPTSFWIKRIYVIICGVITSRVWCTDEISLSDVLHVFLNFCDNLKEAKCLSFFVWLLKFLFNSLPKMYDSRTGHMEILVDVVVFLHYKEATRTVTISEW